MKRNNYNFIFIFFSLFLFNPISNAQYCDAVGASGTTTDWISKVRIYDVVKSSGKTAYSDFTNIEIELAQEADYPLFVHMNNTFDLDTVFVWIDYNQNEIFEPNERVLYSGFEVGETVAESLVTVPANATLGATRMRVRSIYINNPIDNYSCGSIFGEVEDYTVNIIANDCPNVGDNCDDGIECTTDDTIDANCNCRGDFEDDDLDGICNEEDQCPGEDDNLDINNNGIPDILENYCEASGSTNTGGDFIERVRLYDINNFSGKTRYSDFTNIRTELVQGVSYDIDIHGAAVFDLDVAYAWIDFNQNNKFEESESLNMGEFFGLISTGNFDVPDDALLGSTRMRVRIIYGENIENPACNEQFGEVEDYEIDIVASDCPNMGDTCDDGLACSINDVIDANCNCRGEIEDDDFDGVCNQDDICPGEDDFADLNNNGILDCQDYCLAQGIESLDNNFIKEVAILNENFDTIFTNPSGESTYSDFSMLNANLVQNENYFLFINIEQGTGLDIPQAWVDWDNSRSFEEGEFIEMGSFVDDTLAAGFFTVPEILNNSSFRLRVRNLFSQSGIIDPCNEYIGEVEDYTVNISGNSNVNEVKTLSYNLFPNPVSDILYLELAEVTNSESSIEIFNSIGKIQYTTKVIGQNISVNTASWESGIYWIRIFDKDGIRYKTKRFFVQ